MNDKETRLTRAAMTGKLLSMWKRPMSCSVQWCERLWQGVAGPPPGN
jgi:hypothetical protein